MYAGHSDSGEGGKGGEGQAGGETLKCGGHPCLRVMTGWGVVGFGILRWEPHGALFTWERLHVITP